MDTRNTAASARQTGISSKNKTGFAGLALLWAPMVQAAGDADSSMNGWVWVATGIAVLASGLYLQSTRRRTG